jgi:hypothetical protein
MTSITKKALLLGCILACDDAPAPPPAPAPTPAPSQERAPGPALTTFDPFTAKPGDTIAGVTLAAIDVRMAMDSLPSGSASFTGEIELRGEYRPHFDYPEVDVPCFWADSASWRRLPRMQGDTRRQVWFCFRNQEEAVRQLGPMGTRAAKTIVIDSFTTNVTRSDAWDEAALVRVTVKE